MIIQAFGFFFEGFDVGVDVVFARGAVETTLVERFLQILPEDFALAFDSVKQPGDFSISNSVRLTGNLAGNIDGQASSEQKASESEQSNGFRHAGHSSRARSIGAKGGFADRRSQDLSIDEGPRRRYEETQ